MNGPAATPKQTPQILSSWKEIAAFLGKGVRTVQRWESCLGLPVHRPGGSHGGVLAYPTEIDEWCHKLWKESRFGSTARLAAEARPAESGDVLRFVLELANSCSELTRKNEKLRREAARGEPLTACRSLNHRDKTTANSEPGRARRSVGNRRPSPH